MTNEVHDQTTHEPNASEPAIEEPGAAEGNGTARRGGLPLQLRQPSVHFPLAAGGLSLAAVALGYVLMRWAPSPVAVTAFVVGGLLVALALAGYLGTRRGHAAPFVATALLLPYMLTAAVAYGGAQRAANEIEEVIAGGGPGVTQGPVSSDEEPAAPEAAEDDGPPQEPLDGGSYTWESGVTLTMNIARKEPWGSTDDYCGDGSCGISDPDDLRVVIDYEVSVPESVTEPFDASSCPGELHVSSGNDDEALIGVAGDYASYIDGRILPGQTKTGSAEYSIERSALGQEFYIESACGDPYWESDGPVYFVGTIDE